LNNPARDDVFVDAKVCKFVFRGKLRIEKFSSDVQIIDILLIGKLWRKISLSRSPFFKKTLLYEDEGSNDVMVYVEGNIIVMDIGSYIIIWHIYNVIHDCCNSHSLVDLKIFLH